MPFWITHQQSTDIRDHQGEIVVTEQELRTRWVYNDAQAEKWLFRTGFLALPAVIIFVFANFDLGLEFPSSYLMWINLLVVALGLGIAYSLFEALAFKARARSARNQLSESTGREPVEPAD